MSEAGSGMTGTRTIAGRRRGVARPTTVATVFHFSEDGSIGRFTPQVPPSDPGHAPVVWAVDGDHAPLYWFPRRCPRVTVWARDDAERAVLAERFATDATRICATESGWLDQIRTCRLYRYEFDGAAFAPSTDGVAGHWEAAEALEPAAVVELADLVGLHAAAEVELRLTPTLGTLTDRILSSGLPFAFANLRDARR
jgi:hypothetical protein